MNTKRCSTCRLEKPLSEFYRNRSRRDGLTAHCKPCKRAWSKRDRDENPLRRAATHKRWCSENPGRRTASVRRHQLAKLRRTPAWADLAAIAAFYEKCPPGHQVDHVLPLQGRHVSGLHVLANLQYLTASENASKCNR